MTTYIYIWMKVAICLVGIAAASLQLQGEDFHAVTDCVCPEETVVYECTVCDGPVTVWGGSGFQCSSGEIILEHSDFSRPGQCNDGRITARGIHVENRCYTSQLFVTFDAGLEGSTIECSTDDGITSRLIGSGTIKASTESFQPPQTIYVVEVNHREITFSWNQTQENCSSITYSIMSNNCGNCHVSDNTSASCSNFIISESPAAITICSLAVKVVVCSRSLTPVVGNASTDATVNLTVPTISDLSIIPHYRLNDGLRRLTVSFSTVKQVYKLKIEKRVGMQCQNYTDTKVVTIAIKKRFFISDGIYGDTSSYTITYSNSANGATCGLDTFLAANCTEGVCTTVFDTFSSGCSSSDVNVTVFANTNIGAGPKSNPIKEEHLNNYVRVQTVSISINCMFLNLSNKDRKSCNATVAFGDDCENEEQLTGVNEVGSDVVMINLREFLEKTTSAKYCNYTVTVAAGTRFLYVEGDLNVISFGTGSNRSSVIAPVVTVLVLVIVIIIIIVIIIFTLMFHRLRNTREIYTVSTENISQNMFTVEEKCNMIKFATKQVPNYNPDSGKGYFQLTADASPPVYISSKTELEVLLISKDQKKICTGSKARKAIGFKDEKTPIELSDLSGNEWRYVFIQSTSRLRVLPQGSRFLFYEKKELEKQNSSTSLASQVLTSDLKVVEEKFYRMFCVRKECSIPKFVKRISDLKYNPGLGYGFYEFTKPELISYDQQVILMDKEGKLYYGKSTRHVIIDRPDYDESKEINPPKFDSNPSTRWKHAFIQTRSDARVLLPRTHFLYCTVALMEIEQISAPFEVFNVDEENEDKRKLIKFAKEKIPYYNPRAGYGYYEFSQAGYILPERNVIAMKKLDNKLELYTGPGVRQLIGAAKEDGGTREIKPPDFSNDQDWECIFIQGRAYGRILNRGTRFLYCEYDYNPKLY